MSVRMMLPEEVIKSVVDHQFHSALTAMDTNNQVEFSGFGKYVFHTKRATKDLEEVTVNINELKTQLITHQENVKAAAKINSRINMAMELQSYLKSKLYGIQ